MRAGIRGRIRHNIKRQEMKTLPNKIAGHEPPTRHVSRTLAGFGDSSGWLHGFGAFAGGRR